MSIAATPVKDVRPLRNDLAVICTRSGEVARSFRHNVEAGTVGVNVAVAAPAAWFSVRGLERQL